MTKADIASAVYDKIGYSRKYSEELVDEFFNIIKKHLKKGQAVQIQGLGKFTVKNKKARRGRNPQTGESLMISARKVLLFHASTRLKKNLN